jgi:purine nucleosidase
VTPTGGASGATAFVLDTDIGTNVDDLLALLFVLGSPELDLVGVTTVSGDTGVRAGVAAHALALAGRDEVPVVAGAGDALSGTPPRWAGHEAGLAPPAEPRRGATGWLHDAARRHGGGLVVGAVAPLTNLALALRADGGFASGVRRVHLMGGGAPPGAPDHNLRADAVAAAEVLDALAVVLCGVDATAGVTLDEPGLRAVLGPAADRPLGGFVLDHARVFWAGRGVDRSTPHDPLALLPAVRPDLVRSVIVPTAVAADGAVVDGGRPQRRVVAITPEGVAETYRRIAAGAASS